MNRLFRLHVIQRGSGLSGKLPVEFYLTISYADGSPAECEVEVHGPLSRTVHEPRKWYNGWGQATTLSTLTVNALIGEVPLANGLRPERPDHLQRRIGNDKRAFMKVGREVAR
jgi:hypothetical protein